MSNFQTKPVSASDPINGIGDAQAGLVENRDFGGGMENKGLLLIPDLSGFSNFVTTRELKCSQHVIKELLEVLIDSNQLGLEISEIEGDAVLFFKFGPLPELKDIFDQVKKM